MFSSLQEESGFMCANGFRVGFRYHGKSFANPDDVATAFGLRPLHDKWYRVSRDEAVSLLSKVLQQHLGWLGNRFPVEHAEKMARDFVNWFPENAEFFSSGMFDERGMFQPAGELTSATLDAAVVAHSRDLSGILCIEDED